MLDYEQKLKNMCSNIVYLRKRDHLSKTEMAKIMGIGTKQLRQLESGTVSPRLGGIVLVRLSNHFHIKIDSLLRTYWGD